MPANQENWKKMGAEIDAGAAVCSTAVCSTAVCIVRDECPPTYPMVRGQMSACPRAVALAGGAAGGQRGKRRPHHAQVAVVHKGKNTREGKERQ